MDHPYRVAAAPAGLACPRCDGITLQRRSLGHVSVDECPRCQGVFVATAALAAIVEDIGLYGEVRSAYPAGPIRQPAGPMYIKCPRCADVMNRRVFAPGAAVVVDVCRQHGTWFDARELPAVVTYVEAGGRTHEAELARTWAPPKPAQPIDTGLGQDREVTLAERILSMLFFW